MYTLYYSVCGKSPEMSSVDTYHPSGVLIMHDSMSKSVETVGDDVSSLDIQF